MVMDYDDAPAIQLSNPAAEFIDNRLDANFHPSLANSNMKYDPAIDAFRSRKAIKQ